MSNERLNQIASFYNIESEKYDDGYSATICKAEDAIVTKIISPFLNGNVLDVGAGSGLFCEMCNVSNYYGIELSQEMTEKAKSKYPEKCFSVADMHSIPFPNESFDTVVSLYGPMSYSLTPNALITEISRVLKPGGNIALMPYTLRVGHNLEIGGYSTAIEPTIEKKFYTEKMARQLLRDFKNIKVYGINYFLNTEIRFSQEMKLNDNWTLDQMINFLEKESTFQENLNPEMARHMIAIGTKAK